MDLPESDREEVYETRIAIKIHEIMEYFGGGKRSVQAGGDLLEAGFICICIWESSTAIVRDYSISNSNIGNVQYAVCYTRSIY